MPNMIDPIWIFSACVFLGVFVVLETIQSLFVGAANYRSQVNRRLEQQAQEISRVQTIIDLRRSRGLSVKGDWLISLVWLNKLIVQSGVNVSLPKVVSFVLGAGIISALCGYFIIGIWAAIVVFPIAGCLLPIVSLMFLRRRRIKKFTDQLAEAIDIIVRSLRAGHPVPSAIKLAARELPDPIGTEFGTIEDEITFGLDLESAMRNMYERVGQEDLPLLIASIAIQTSSGGNLTEILEGLSSVIRSRVKMRRKITAISAEGRISALILSVTPFALFGIINAMNPTFYGGKWHDPTMTYGLAGAFIWMMIGNLWMRRMINFKV